MIKVRTLFKIDRVKVSKLSKNMDIMFEDGVIIKNCYYKDIIVFRYLLDFINEFDIKITSDLWITNYYVNGYTPNKTYLNLYSKIFRKIVQPYISKYKNNDIMIKMFKLMYETIDNFNREFMPSIVSYTQGLDIADLLDLQFDKDLIDSMVKVNKEKTPKSVENVYKTLQKVMKKPEYKDLSISLLYNSEIGSVGQISQMFGSRGFITELNSKIFTTPMVNSFILGFKNVYEAVIESRAGAKALYLSGKGIQNTEYANREIQLATMVVERVYHGDCGKPVYIDFYIKPDEYDPVTGVLIHKNKLNELIGKRYLSPIDNKEYVITNKDTHLIGTTIKMRSAVKCGLSNKKMICSACIGEIADSIFNHQNLGNMATVVLMTLLSQGLLSAKHLLKSATSASIKLNNILKKYFILRNNEDLYFKSNVLNKKTKTIYLKIKQSESWGLDTLKDVKDILSINVNNISKIKTVWLVFRDKHGAEEEVELEISKNHTKAFLSLQFLSYVINHGYEIVDELHYLINISDYNIKNPLIKFDKTEYNLASLASEFKNLIKSHKHIKVNNEIRSEYTSDVLVNKIFDLLNSKLSVNIALIEILVYTFTVKDLTNLNFDLGRGSKSDNIIGFKQAINYRSLGTAYDWDDLQNKVLDPILFKTTHKVSSNMDVFLKPNEVVKNKKR